MKNLYGMYAMFGKFKKWSKILASLLKTTEATDDHNSLK